MIDFWSSLVSRFQRFYYFTLVLGENGDTVGENGDTVGENGDTAVFLPLIARKTLDIAQYPKRQ